LPTNVNFVSGDISYIYDATGVKLKKIVSTGTTTEYAGNYIYEDGTLKMFSHPEGYVEPRSLGKSITYDYVYQYKDHLGNIRLSYADSNGDGNIDTVNEGVDTDGDGDFEHEIIEENNYYPFGLTHKGYNELVTANANSMAVKFGFNGMELEDSDIGGDALDLYEMSFRQYDPAIARWTSIDPVVHFEYSTFSAFDNNPVFWTDPSGADSLVHWGSGFGPSNQADETSGDSDNGIQVMVDGSWHTISSHAGITIGNTDPKNKKNKCVDADGNTVKCNSKTQSYINATNELDKVTLWYSLSEGDITEAKYFSNLYWRAQLDGFAAEFDAGWLNWDPDGLGNFLMNVTTYSVVGSLSLPFLSGTGSVGYLGLGSKISSALAALEYYSVSAYFYANTVLSTQLSALASAAGTLNYKYGYQLHNFITGYKGVKSYTPNIYFSINVELIPFMEKAYSVYDDASSLND
ncbi:RHS repeat-associated core domain-containing protein, partial [Winogradskyella sp.]|uniref:RHS repeat-associated core domain-containing protein n=1 Tax=Winogradskyella sp. TaxID=1883156 RepID=UPI001B1A40E9|nr:hypothetical protein [Winogradskyella sp.]